MSTPRSLTRAHPHDRVAHPGLTVPASGLRRHVAASCLPFRSTADLEPLSGTIGQPRALDALQLGLEVGARGYNIFVTGMPGSGREGMVRDHLGRVAASRPPADDWVYVENFSDPDSPRAFRLPAGRGAVLASRMREFLDAASGAIRTVLESSDFVDRRQQAMSALTARRAAVVADIKRFADARGFAAEPTMTGFMTVPLLDGRPIDADRFATLPPDTREDLERRGEEIQARVAEVAVELRQLEKEVMQTAGRVERETAELAIAPLVRDVQTEFAALPAVVAHIEAVKDELLAHLEDIGPAEPSELPPALAMLSSRTGGRLDRYQVNVFVGNPGTPGVPIVVERNPTYYNLMGRIDYRSAFGTMVTDLQHIKPGALHRANGGFLVLHASEVLRSPFAWEALKGALTDGLARLENLAVQYSAVPTVTLRPEPIPLDLKVVLIGTPLMYRMLCQLDDDFRALFKVKVDFVPDMEWNDEAAMGYAALVARLVRDHGLRHFRPTAVARIVEHGARMRDDQRKLSTRMGEIADVVTEASYWATRAGHRLVGAGDVSTAIAERERRSNMVEERVREQQARGIIRIETGGARVGQVNGVAVVDLGDHTFGLPCRISAQTALGHGGVQSIEREIHLSGPLHSKGVMILSGYVAATYAQKWPLALAATLTFEQSYDEVEGDSASCAELAALLSALADIPLQQGIAVTGAIDQHGAVEPVGGVTTKVEGFFHACAAAGLTGHQGMVIPARNRSSLMLSDEVVEAVRAGRFRIWAVERVDQALEILTGVRAGRRRRDGTFAADTLHGAVHRRLQRYAESGRDFGGAHTPPPAPNGRPR